MQVENADNYIRSLQSKGFIEVYPNRQGVIRRGRFAYQVEKGVEARYFSATHNDLVHDFRRIAITWRTVGFVEPSLQRRWQK